MKQNFFQMREAASKEVEDTLEDTLAEATNWKGTDHLSLTRYAAGKGVGYGLQITQNKRMGNDKFRMGAHVSMPLKDVPKLVKSLMKVYNDKGSQLGDNESVKVEDDVGNIDAKGLHRLLDARTFVLRRVPIWWYEDKVFVRGFIAKEIAV